MSAGVYPNRYDVPAKVTPPPPPAFNMRERREPTFKTFADGEVITGVLANLERINIRDKQSGQPKSCVRYTVIDLETSESISFLGCYQIDSKLRTADMGHVIEVRNEGTDKNVSRGGNAMKIFKVSVSDQPAPGWAMDGTPITDADLPASL